MVATAGRYFLNRRTGVRGFCRAQSRRRSSKSWSGWRPLCYLMTTWPPLTRCSRRRELTAEDEDEPRRVW